MTNATLVVLSIGTLAMLFTRATAPSKSAATLSQLAVAGGYRIVQPRLSISAPHVAFRMVPPGEHFAAILKKRPDVLATTPDSGLAHLLLADWTKAIESLDPKSQAVDLSAAYYMRGLATGSLHDFARALQALSTASDSPAVTFNRALILEQLSDRPAATAEWLHYLTLDPNSEWASEARRHLRENAREPVSLAWQRDKRVLIAAAASGDATRVRELTHRYPLGARRLVELELLPAWGEAILRNDHPAAAHNLRAAREIVRHRSVPSEQRLLAALVEIDASGTTLAEAYALYGRGNAARDDSIFASAVSLFIRAHAAAGSDAHVFGAIVLPAIIEAHYRMYEHARAQELIDTTRERYAKDADRFVTLFARLDWLGGLIEIARGEASNAIHLYQRALSAYQRLGEPEYVAAQHICLADSLSYLGETDRAGTHVRNALLHATNAEDPQRLHGILKVAANLTLETSGLAASIAFKDRLVRRARADGRAWWLADALVSRTPLLVQAGRHADALRDLAEMHRLASQVKDVPTRQRLIADAKAAEALAYRDRDHQRVIANLTRALELFAALEIRPFLAQLFLERGRTHLRLGDEAAAERDFRSGVEELERQRKLVDESELRIAYFDRADSVFVDLALLLLRKGKAEDAFELLERSRSRELLDRTSGGPSQPLPVAQIRAGLPPDTVLVTHTVSTASLITCIVTRDGVRTLEQVAGEAMIERLVDALNTGFDSPQGLPDGELRRLSELLLAGIPREASERIIFVPDRILHRAPFAALQSANGRYLIEDETIAVAPSATMAVRRLAVEKRGSPSVFVVASPERPEGFDNLPALTRAVEEAKGVAASYQRSHVVMGGAETPKALLETAGGYDTFHFAGHSVIDRRTPARSSLLVGANGRITAADIEAAHLPRLRLVVLGGCNTALGKSHRSEGVMSIARSFMAASVPAVVGTVAPIEDAAAERVLTEFHRVYARGLDPASALREAQLRMLRSKDPEESDPARWSSFQVIGSAG